LKKLLCGLICICLPVILFACQQDREKQADPTTTESAEATVFETTEDAATALETTERSSESNQEEIQTAAAMVATEKNNLKNYNDRNFRKNSQKPL